MLYRLIFLSGPRTGERITVAEAPMTIGRAAGCTVAVPDPEMAREHAVIEQKDAELFIRDLGSMNRILVNKREVREIRLKHGDEIELGRTRLVVQALVQADLEGSPTAHRRRYRAAWAVAACLLIGIVLALSARYAPHPRPAGPATDTRVAKVAINTNTPSETPAEPPVSNVTEHLRGLREDIQAIQDTVKSLAEQPRPTEPPVPAGAPAPVPEDEVTALFEAAEAARAGGKLPEAEALLARVQQLDPDFLPAYEARATVLELMGQRGAAAGQWSEVLRRNMESPLYQKAVAERIRLSEAATPEPAPDVQALKISQVQQHRFQAGEDYEEMRTLQIDLAPASPGLRVDRGAVRVEVTFYDRDPETGAVEPTEARVSQEAGQPAAAWGREGENIVSATYVVPRGLRAGQLAQGRARIFHGYRVRVFYRDRLQDEVAVPRTLAGLPLSSVTP